MKSKLKACTACGGQIAKSATTCPHCGKSSTSVARIGLVIILTLLVVWVASRYFTSYQSDNAELDRMEQQIRNGH
ncbi:MAG: hypothetical protein ABIS50_15360 [Luteolibacter sp.]|uniref:hypothetical protein n=1 Tax=Luteolibacter sp. TaxID=1962973 RepID=UPI003263F885